MPNDISLPSPNINPGSMGGGGQFAPNPLDAFVTNFLSAQQRKSSESQAMRSHEIEKARLDLIREDLKFRQEKERTQQANTDAEGKGAQALIKALTPRIEQESQYAPPGQPTPTMQMLGLGPQNGQQGVQQPQGAPNASQSPQSTQPDPMAIFSGIVDKLPAGAVADFVKQFGGIAQQAQAKRDQGRALDEADRLTKGILTPDQANQLKTARLLAESGAPKELWESMLPKAQIDLAGAMEDVRSKKNKREADRAATVQLAKMGMAPKAPVGMDEFIVDGAAKILADHIGTLRVQAQKANLDRRAAEKAEEIKGLAGTAMEIAAGYPDMSPAQIKAALKATPAYAGLPDGVIAQAALEAPKKARMLTAPANETEAKARVVYGPARAALAVVNAMDKKGARMGKAAFFAGLESISSGAALGGAGAAAGSAIGTPLVGGIIGGLAGGAAGAIGAPIARGIAKNVMSEDEQRMYTAGQSVAAAVLRPETGQQASASEIRTTIGRYFPLSTDKPRTVADKRIFRAELDKTLANVSGLPKEIAKAILDKLLTEHEQKLLRDEEPNATEAPSSAPRVVIPGGISPSAQRPWR